MANTKRVQLRRGTTAEHAVFTGAEGELTIDTTKDIAIVHDGVTQGGHELVGTASSQSIVNKTAIAIGTTVADSELTVVGRAVISGVSTFYSDLDVFNDLTVSNNISVSGESFFSGSNEEKYVNIGVGTTDLLVVGNAKITDTLSLGNNKISLNPNTNTITGESGYFTKLNVSNEDVINETFNKIVAENVSIGSTVITLDSTSSLIVGDFISITGIFDKVNINEIKETDVSPYYREEGTVSISTAVSIGSTIIGVSQVSGLTTSSYISISGIITNVPIVGFGTTSIGEDWSTISSIGLGYTVSIGSTEIPTLFASIESRTYQVGDYVSVAGTDQTFIDRAEILGISTYPGTPYEVFSASTVTNLTVGAGSTLISIGSTAGIAANSFLSISGIFNLTPILGVVNTGVSTSYSPLTTTSVSYNVSAGSTIIGVASTSGITTNSAIDISGIFDKVIVTGVGQTTITIGTASTYSGTISSGLALTAYAVNTNNLYSAVIGIGSTSNQEIAENTTVTIFNQFIPYYDSIIIGTANTSNSILENVYVATIERKIYPFSDAIIIGFANTANEPISQGSTITYSSLQTTRPSVVIGVADTSSSVISSGSTAIFDRKLNVESNLNVDNLRAVGITTLEQLILGQITLPSVDGLKGQVLVTDGAGNVAFGTGGGSGGSDVVLRVSSKTGSDDNDGKILPLRTIKKASQLASKVGKPVTILVETGEYYEENPIIVYDSVSIIGDSLRNIIVRPANAGKDLFKVRNGCYITGMSFNDHVDSRGVPQHTYDYAISFDDPYNTTVDRTGYAATYTSLNIVGATYNHVTGFTTVTTESAHELARENSVRMVGLGWTCGYDEAGISTFVYDHVSGVSTITFFSDNLFGNVGTGYTQRGYVVGDELFLNNLPFSCSVEHAGVTTTIFPYEGLDSVYGSVYPITGVNTATKTVTIQGGISTIPHIYEGFETIAISTFSYDHLSGIATAVTATPHGFDGNDRIALQGLEFSCVSGAGTTTIFPDGTVTTYSADGYTFKVANVIDSTTFEYYVGVSTIAHTYESGGTVQKVPTVQEVWKYPDRHKDGQDEFGVISVESSTVFTIRGQTIPSIPHYYTKGGTIRLSRPIINKSPYIQNCSILSSLGGNGILVDGDKVATINKGIVPELGEVPVVGDQPEFGKSMVAATFTMVSFGGIGWRTVNDGYAQVVSCFQIFCRYGSLTQSGGYLSITNSATNFGDKALRSTGFSRNSFRFDRSRVVANGTQDGLQTLRVIGLGRSDQELYVCRFIDSDGVDRTANFKPLVQTREFTIAGVNTETNVFTIAAHPFIQGESIVYSGNENANPPQVLGGLVNDASYYVDYIDASHFRLFEDESLRTEVDVFGSFSGVGTFTKNNQEFYNYEIVESHNSYQKLTLASAGSTANFVSGRQITQGSATGYALTYSQSNRELIVSVESIGGVRNFFNTQSDILDHSDTPISVGINSVVGITTQWSMNFKVESTSAGNLISNINNLTENYQLYFHRPSIINSSAHTWEYAGSGTDYNALPQNGGQARPGSEQVSELGGRVYASGTNELGDFKIGTQITAFNRTGNIIFNNKVTIGELASIRLSLSGGVAVDEFSTDTGLGDNEVGGPRNSRVSTQLAVKSFFVNRLGSFIDKQVSTNAIPNAVVQLNAQGQINSDLIPPQVVNFNITNVGGGRTVLVNQIPAVNLKQGDTIVEPDDSYVLINDVNSQYLILDDDTSDFAFQNGDSVTSALTHASSGIVTGPPNGIGIGTQVQNYVGYGSTGLVKGVLLNLSITNGGGGYLNAGIYTGVSLTTLTGIGQSAYGTVTIGAGFTATFISAFAGGRGYQVGDMLSVSDSLVGGRSGGSQLQAMVTDVETRLYLDLIGGQKFPGTIALPDYIADSNAGTISTSLTDEYAVSFSPIDIGTGGNIDFANDTIYVGVGHDFKSGDPIVYDPNGGSMVTTAGEPFLPLFTYYTKPVGISSVELYHDYSLNNKINFTGSGIGTHFLRRRVVNVTANKLVVVGHGYTVGDPFRVTGNTPTGITTNEFYYIGAVTVNSFTLHATQADALLSVNSVIFNPVSIAATSSGTITLTEQNVRYSESVNTSSQELNNYALLAKDSIDATSIVSGIVPSSRLGIGAANEFTFLNGSSEYKKVAVSIGIGTTEPLSATATSSELAPNGIGINTYYGNISLKVNRVSAVGIDDYTSLGAARFKKTTFNIGSDGEVSIKAGTQGDIDAASLAGQGAAYYLDANNHTNSVPITRGGTGLTGVPADGYILIGNGSAYNLTNSPSFSGTVSAPLFSGPASSLRSFDTRNVVTTPNSFGAESGIRFDFKSNSTNGLSDGGTYNGVMYWRRYGSTGGAGDFSGGGAAELAYTDNARLWLRYGSGSTWGNWKRVLFGDNFDNGGNVRLTSLGVGQAASGTSGECRATSFVETSSITLKENISPISSALDNILKLNPVTYDRKDGSYKNEAGLIAEEVNEILPNMVTKDENGNPDGIHYTKLNAYLIQCIKELKSELNDIKISINKNKA